MNTALNSHPIIHILIIIIEKNQRIRCSEFECIYMHYCIKKIFWRWDFRSEFHTFDKPKVAINNIKMYNNFYRRLSSIKYL